MTIYKCFLWKCTMATGSNVMWKSMNAAMRQLCPILQLSNIFHFSHDGAYLSPTSVDLHVQLPKFSSKPCSLLSSYCQRISSALPRLQKAPKYHHHYHQHCQGYTRHPKITLPTENRYPIAAKAWLCQLECNSNAISRDCSQVQLS